MSCRCTINCILKLLLLNDPQFRPKSATLYQPARLLKTKDMPGLVSEVLALADLWLGSIGDGMTGIAGIT
jgi:hypothetical protein